MRLSKLLKKKPFCNDCHHFLFVVILFLLCFKSIGFIPLLFLYLVYLYLKTKLIIPILILISFFILRLSIFTIALNIEIPNEMEVYVSEVEDTSYICYYSGIKIKVYEKNHLNEPGDIVYISYKESYLKDKSYEEEFNYKEYLYSKEIYHQGLGRTRKQIKNTFSIHSLKYQYKRYLKENLSNESYSYLMAVVFGENNLEENIKDSYSILGLSHILAISGLHIIFLYHIISFCLLKLFHYYDNKIPLLILFLYCIFLGFIPSCFRAFLFLLFTELNKKGRIKYTKLDILSITAILFLLYNPYLLNQTGFILTFLVSFVLLFIERKELENKLLFQYRSYIIIYFSTLPFVINITNKISLLSFLLSPIFSTFIGFILLPISYILSLLPILDYVFKYVYLFLNTYLEGISQYTILLPIRSFSLFYMVIYYALFLMLVYFILKRKRMILGFSLFISYLLLFLNLDFANPYYRITFIDCGQGDSCLIELPNNKGRMLIDAFNSYSYLKSRGISSIDYFIITHSDSDHIGDYEKILKNMNVSMIYYPIYDEKCITLLKNYKSKGIKSGYEFLLSNLDIKVIAPIENHNDANSNSIVLQFDIFNKTYLFGADMELIEENDIIKKYKNELKSDILKVSHHGSDTSSSKALLDYVRPNYSIISVGYQNSYHLPKQEVVKRLSEYGKVYITYKMGNITIYQKENTFFIKTFKNS